MTPPTPQAMVLPTISATQPPETSGSESYLRIIKDMMGKFSPTGKMRDLLTHIAKEIRNEEANPSPIPFETPTDPTLPAETPAVHPHEESTLMYTTFPHTCDQEDDTEAMRDTWNNSRVEGELSGDRDELEEGEDEEVKGNVVIEEGESREEPAEKDSAKKEKEIVVVEGGESEEDEETLDERAARRHLRTWRRLETEEPEAVAAAKREAAERKRKGKQIATPSKKRQLRQGSRTVVIQEPITDLTRSPYRQTEEEEEDQTKDVMDTSVSDGVYEKLRVTIDQKLLEAMVYFKDPKKRKDCAGRGAPGKKVKSGRRLHLPSLRGMDSEE